MQKTKIEWCDSTWNPVTGCLHTCEYCYARRIAERFGTLNKGPQPEDEGLSFVPDEPERFFELDEPVRSEAGRVEPYPANFYPTLHRYRLDEPSRVREPQNIFVCSMADLFGAWVPTVWITTVFDACRKAPRHNYLFLTKNPERYLDLAGDELLPLESNFWYGSTVTGPEDPFFYHKDAQTFLSIEPMLEAFTLEDYDGGFDTQSWIILGAMTGPGSRRHQPMRPWVEAVVNAAQRSGRPVFMKDSMKPIWGSELIREYPTGLHWPKREEQSNGTFR